MQQLLIAHEVPARILDLGAVSYFGMGSPAALHVHAEDQWTALLLLSSPSEELLEGD